MRETHAMGYFRGVVTVTNIRSSTRNDLPASQAGTIAIGNDLEVNRMGYGAMRLTGKGIIGQPADRDEAKRVLRRAVELGVDFIDTADSYGPYVSEELIAEALHPYPEGLVIATKGGLERPGPDQWTPNGRPEHLRAALEGSLRRLKLERIDLWQLHRIDPHVPEDEQFGVLAEFVREGKVRHVGLSEVGVAEIERARRVVPIVSVQNRYNIIDRQWEDVVDYAEREGMAFIPWFPLAAGNLTTEQQAARDRLIDVARRRGATPAQVALAWLFARSPAILNIPGTSKVKHLEENIAAAGIELTDAELRELNGEAAA
ncbi:MAG TPA: aldo/keto reductase [Gemmatimonadaceae bacterium]|nr:aldo/keto reductase [Gemmatimonadaceae bacterium]